NFISRWCFGVKGKDMKKLFAEVLKDTSAEFLKWAMYAIATWENKENPQNVFHIHGGSDNLLPIDYVDADFTIKTGGHLMVFDHAEKISEEIKRYFSL
ncbi:MAG TPA: alpha/beta hydrolase, partial [Bacteroidia bacterium]|nr:alpha/beta hydrolase [Bacteroidia bacterium]